MTTTPNDAVEALADADDALSKECEHLSELSNSGQLSPKQIEEIALEYASSLRANIAEQAEKLDDKERAMDQLTLMHNGLVLKNSALKAENKRLRDECRWAEGALRNAMELLEECKCNRSANQKNAAYVTLHHFLNRIKSALAQHVVAHKAPEVSDKVVCGSHVSDKQPEPQKCWTCGGTGLVTEWVENIPACQVDCHVCHGTGKAGE